MILLPLNRQVLDVFSPYHSVCIFVAQRPSHTSSHQLELSRVHLTLQLAAVVITGNWPSCLRCGDLATNSVPLCQGNTSSPGTFSSCILGQEVLQKEELWWPCLQDTWLSFAKLFCGKLQRTTVKLTSTNLNLGLQQESSSLFALPWIIFFTACSLRVRVSIHLDVFSITDIMERQQEWQTAKWNM